MFSDKSFVTVHFDKKNKKNKKRFRIAQKLYRRAQQLMIYLGKF